MTNRNSYRKWTEKEVEILINRHGTYSLQSTAKKLNRTLTAIQVKAYRIGLTDNRDAFDYIIRNRLAEALGIYGATIDFWIEKKGFPVKKIIPCKVRKFSFVSLNEFWEWAENNKELIDWTKLEKNVLGKEPFWVDVERKNITLKKRPTKVRGWGAEEEKILVDLYNKGESYKEIAKILGRSPVAIQSKLKRTKNTKSRRVEWRFKEIVLLKELVKEGLTDKEIGKRLGRSGSSITTKRLYLKKRGEL